jgi:Na+-transporting methylmalonyl-CoA/oxaloacetate decarboxylase gamma subunit
MFDIAEWIANILVLGMGVFFWTLSIMLFIIFVDNLINRLGINESK